MNLMFIFVVLKSGFESGAWCVFNVPTLTYTYYFLMSPNRRIFLNIIATYGRSLYALVLGLFTARWVFPDLFSDNFLPTLKFLFVQSWGSLQGLVLFAEMLRSKFALREL